MFGEGDDEFASARQNFSLNRYCIRAGEVVGDRERGSREGFYFCSCCWGCALNVDCCDQGAGVAGVHGFDKDLFISAAGDGVEVRDVCAFVR